MKIFLGIIIVIVIIVQFLLILLAIYYLFKIFEYTFQEVKNDIIKFKMRKNLKDYNKKFGPGNFEVKNRISVEELNSLRK